MVKIIRRRYAYLKKNKKILFVILILLAIVLSFIGGKTFSKYMSTIQGSGTAEIANWVFKVNGTEDLVKNVDLLSTYNNETLIDNKVAPGTSGSFDIIIDATGSEVGVDYKVKFLNETEKPQNLIFIYNDNEYATIQELQEDLSGTINADEDNKTRTITINWKWQYETGENENEINQNDIIDTQNAKDFENYTFDINVIGTQVMPK